jgi:hypothetical protein
VETFTCITRIRAWFHISQHVAAAPDVALRSHIAAVPNDALRSQEDDCGPSEEELQWLQRVSGGQQNVEIIVVEHCKNTWLWLDGARYEPQYITYIVKTDVNGLA